MPNLLFTPTHANDTLITTYRPNYLVDLNTDTPLRPSYTYRSLGVPLQPLRIAPLIYESSPIPPYTCSLRASADEALLGKIDALVGVF